jgi:hypothetical protein
MGIQVLLLPIKCSAYIFLGWFCTVFIFASNAVSNLDFTLKATEAKLRAGWKLLLMILLRKEAFEGAELNIFSIYYIYYKSSQAEIN